VTLEYLDDAVDVVEPDRSSDDLRLLALAEWGVAHKLVAGRACRGGPRRKTARTRVADLLESAARERLGRLAPAGDRDEERMRAHAEGAVVDPRDGGGDRLLLRARDAPVDEGRLVKRAPHSREQLRVRGVDHERRVPVRIAQEPEVSLDLPVDLSDEPLCVARSHGRDEAHQAVLLGRPLSSPRFETTNGTTKLSAHLT
jgi:hypothetical protein